MSSDRIIVPPYNEQPVAYKTVRGTLHGIKTRMITAVTKPTVGAVTASRHGPKTDSKSSWSAYENYHYRQTTENWREKLYAKRNGADARFTACTYREPSSDLLPEATVPPTHRPPTTAHKIVRGTLHGIKPRMMAAAVARSTWSANTLAGRIDPVNSR
ncbi:uncharacterized protein LOC112693150 [Sipha flava]|uniref:Uncharacterized protein LOC112693150 n=1 Tax=Sipha flava TaxID=143950 RepID=A0A2S2Q014_9HEMI|nr:uncharacterized protein LOC112693150 [Sipha flava]